MPTDQSAKDEADARDLATFIAWEAAASAMLAALKQASVELEERMDCDDGRPNWAMRLKVEIDNAIAAAIRAGVSTEDIRPSVSAWLIEAAESDATAPLYWAGSFGDERDRWTDDHMAAVRLARRQDADAICRSGVLSGYAVRICEHAWDAAVASAKDSPPSALSISDRLRAYADCGAELEYNPLLRAHLLEALKEAADTFDGMRAAIAAARAAGIKGA